jgi:hypothetical protein
MMQKLSDAIETYVEFRIEMSKPLHYIPTPADLDEMRKKKGELKANIDAVMAEIVAAAPE